MRLIFLMILLSAFAASAKPRASEADAPAPTWSMTDQDLEDLLRQGTAAKIGALPGVSAQTARFIVRLRDGKAEYQATDQSTEFKGVEQANVDRVLRLLNITSRGSFDTLKPGEEAQVQEDPRGVNLNTATAAQLAALEGIGPELAEAIVALRTQKGSFKRLAELTEVKGIGAARLEKLKPLLHLGDTATHEVGH